MDYINYLQDFDFTVFYKVSFLLPFLGIIVLIKILSLIVALINSRMDDSDDDIKITPLSNIIFYIIFSFSLVTIHDHYNGKQNQNFKFSNYGYFSEFEEINQNYREPDNITDTVDNNKTIVIDQLPSVLTKSELLSLEKDPKFMVVVDEIFRSANDYVGFVPEETCGQEEGVCKWCGKTFLQDRFTVPTIIAITEQIGKNMLIIHDGWNDNFTYKYVKDYENGIKSQCVTYKKDYCSLKCEKEFKQDRGY
ncbi:hypothetical protein [Chryseobacterium echinoideorum]|uniref:hypothetical protein n=1 Tax=Chryseobacterium echinoideorum TaxID=1549648 RepID=UPI001186B8B5|nr:hypothetical protein [Chryseobacterium echinoideorum]